VSAVGHYLEDEGIPTASISLVREHSEAMRPPRALWVPFMLGRPLGAPNSPEFQRAVLRAVLRLFERPSGPVLEDFPQDAPASVELPPPDDEPGEACPVNFGRPRTAGAGPQALADALQEEIAQLRPWHDLGARRRGGTGVGMSGLSPEQAGAFVAAFLGATPPPNPRPEQPLGQTLKFAADDLRAFYEEAAAAQPGELPPDALQRWFYLETAVGEALRAVRRTALAGTDASLRLVADRSLVPRAMLQACGDQV
jgi:hypothetical protein